MCGMSNTPFLAGQRQEDMEDDVGGDVGDHGRFETPLGIDPLTDSIAEDVLRTGEVRRKEHSLRRMQVASFRGRMGHC